jgi:hypothetical protein
MEHLSGALSDHGKLIGALSPVAGLTGTLSPPRGLTGILTIPRVLDAEYYTGEYEVTPQARSDVILDTSGKLMTDDVIVFEIPYYETTNPAGGYTAIIGG